MKKWMFGLVMGILLISCASAYSSYGTRYVYGFDGAYSQDYDYVYSGYNRPMYRVYYYDDDFEYDRIDAARFMIDSYYDRYAMTAGKTSGQAFCSDCWDDVIPASNWRNKQAYNYFTDGERYGGEYYYKPSYDHSLQKFNWRF